MSVKIVKSAIKRIRIRFIVSVFSYYAARKYSSYYLFDKRLDFVCP